MDEVNLHDWIFAAHASHKIRDHFGSYRFLDNLEDRGLFLYVEVIRALHEIVNA